MKVTYKFIASKFDKVMKDVKPSKDDPGGIR